MVIFQEWACAQISRLLPLDPDSTNQLVTYSSSLPPEEAAAHLKELLGDSPQALEFISSFNGRRPAQTTTKTTGASPSPRENDAVPRPSGKKKKKDRINQLPEVRRPENYGDTLGGYRKVQDEDYMPASVKGKGRDEHSPGGMKPAQRTSSPSVGSSHRAAAFSGLLDPSLPNVHSRTASPARRSHASTPSPGTTPRTSSPAKASASTKVSITGGTPMHGASSTLADLDAAIRALEMSTNPTISTAPASARRCQCMGTVHPVLSSAPNCLKCGKIICLKEGLAPCTFCGSALLTSAQVQEMVRALREERGRERMAVHNAANQRPEVATTPRPFATPRNDAALDQALARHNRLLDYQANNAARTRVIDEAAAFETPDAGVSQWGSAVQRAAQLKRQQQALREIEWNARPDYEKRRMVVSVDLVGGKVVKKMGAIRREEVREEIAPVEQDEESNIEGAGDSPAHAGAFARNPLLGALIRPVWRPNSSEDAPSNDPVVETSKDKGREDAMPRQWRRVQDDLNNEDMILDGGIYGGAE